jgi:HSP20 family protein
MYRRYQRPSIWQEMDQLQREMNRLFDANNAGRVFQSPGYPAINIWTNDDGQLITAEMPGVHPDELEIDVTGDALSISGERKQDEVAKDARYHRRERSYGAFSRTVQLPFMVDTDTVEASFNNGVLQISLPRAEADKPKKITIKSK